MTLSGSVSTFASNIGTPYGVRLDQNRNVYSMDYNGGNIFRITPAGAVSTYATGLGNPMFGVFLPEPAGLSLLLFAGAVIGRRRRSARRSRQ